MPTAGTMTNADVFTVAELAVRWRSTRQTLMEMIHAGRLQAFRLGVGKKSHYRIPAAEVARFESERANPPANDEAPALVKRRAGAR